MIRQWSFTDLDFVVLWEELREHRLPEPFVFTSRTEYFNDSVRAKKEALTRLRDTSDSAFDGVLSAVARPDIRMVVHGVAAYDPRDPRSHLRIHAARRGDRCFVLTQLPGETVWHSGGFTVAEFYVPQMADAVVNHLPNLSAGRRAGMSFPARPEENDEAGADCGRSWVRDTEDNPARTRAEEFLRAPILRTGVIRIEQGSSRFGPRGRTQAALGWRDLADDGRYVITPGNPPTAVGVDAGQLVSRINGEIARIIRVIKDEHAGQPQRI
ncbi:ESX secretion-associated protein EspG [Nocardia goodfellowii]